MVAQPLQIVPIILFSLFGHFSSVKPTSQ